MIRRRFNDEVVAMETAGTGQGRSAGAAAAAITQSLERGGERVVVSAACVLMQSILDR